MSNPCLPALSSAARGSIPRKLRNKYKNPPWFSQDHDAPLVAVDLGKRKVGVAFFDAAGLLLSATTLSEAIWSAERMANAALSWASGQLVDHELLPEASVLPRSPEGLQWMHWVCEWPEVYEKRRSRRKNIAALQQVGFAIARATGGWSGSYEPRVWKGQVSKNAHHPRLARALTPQEKRIAPPMQCHDAWDAIGIGLFALGRTGRGGLQ